MQIDLRRQIYALILLSSCLVSIIAQTTPPGDRPLLGFDRTSTANERALEARFDASLRRENLREWLKRLSAHPHHIGSPYGKQNAEFIASQFRSWGFDTQIEEFSVLFPTPKLRLLKLVSPEKFTAKLAEPALKEDATSSQTSEQLPVYNAYSVDGDVTAPLVYVNYGVPRDYDDYATLSIRV